MSRKTIADSLRETGKASPPPPVDSVETPPGARRPASTGAKPAFQVGKKAMTLYFKPEVSKQLKQIALDEDITLHELMREAINDLFEKRRKPPIA